MILLSRTDTAQRLHKSGGRTHLFGRLLRQWTKIDLDLPGHSKCFFVMLDLSISRKWKGWEVEQIRKSEFRRWLFAGSWIYGRLYMLYESFAIWFRLFAIGSKSSPFLCWKRAGKIPQLSENQQSDRRKPLKGRLETVEEILELGLEPDFISNRNSMRSKHRRKWWAEYESIGKLGNGKVTPVSAYCGWRIF